VVFIPITTSYTDTGWFSKAEHPFKKIIIFIFIVNHVELLVAISLEQVSMVVMLTWIA